MATRKRRTQPSRPPAPEGLTARQLAAKLGVTPRTIRYYTAERVLPPPAFRGTATRYSHAHVVRLAAIRQLQQGRRMPLTVIRQYLKSLRPEEVEALALAFLPELASKVPSKAPVTVTRNEPPPVAATPVAGSLLLDTWQRLAIAPGVELHIQSSATLDERQLLHEIATRLHGIATQ